MVSGLEGFISDYLVFLDGKNYYITYCVLVIITIHFNYPI